MLHSVPSLNDYETETTLQQLLTVGHSIFLTQTRNYTQFDAFLPVFVDYLDGLRS